MVGWSVVGALGWWSVGRWSVVGGGGRWSLVGGWLVGGFMKTQLVLM